MLRLITGFWVSQLIHVAARLGIADALATGARTPAALARRAKVSAAALGRVMSALVDVRILSRDRSGRFRLTSLGKQLRSGPGSLHGFALLMMADCNWEAFGGLTHAIARGDKSAFEHVHGMKVYEYFSRNAELAKLLSDLQGGATNHNALIARAYRFDRFDTLVDVGGSGGQLLAAILQQHPRVSGIVFDRPEVIEHARTSGITNGRGLGQRLQLASGNFFAAVPEGAAGYLLRFIMHNWNDEECVRILRNCRRAMRSGGAVLVLEHLLKPGNGRDYTRIGDIGMLALTGGRERSLAEYSRLLRSAGLKLRRVISTPSPLGVATPLSILEATSGR
jgi:hypothetical protein